MTEYRIVNDSDLVVEFDTNRTHACIYDRDLYINGEKIYVIITTNDEGDKYVRFGNWTQTKSIIKSFRQSMSASEWNRIIKIVF